MTWDNRILWSEGTFLQPQHFQQHDRHLEAQLEQRTRVLRPHGYGFLEIALDESLLELGKLALRGARGVLPDGTPFDCPARDPLPPPLDVPATLRDSLVTLALPVRRPGCRSRGRAVSPRSPSSCGSKRSTGSSRSSPTWRRRRRYIPNISTRHVSRSLARCPRSRARPAGRSPIPSIATTTSPGR